MRRFLGGWPKVLTDAPASRTADRAGTSTPPAFLEPREQPGEQPGEWIIRATRRYGPGIGMATSKDWFFARTPPRDAARMRPWVVPALAAESNTPSGRRRVAIHLWRAARQGQGSG